MSFTISIQLTPILVFCSYSNALRTNIFYNQKPFISFVPTMLLKRLDENIILFLYVFCPHSIEVYFLLKIARQTGHSQNNFSIYCATISVRKSFSMSVEIRKSPDPAEIFCNHPLIRKTESISIYIHIEKNTRKLYSRTHIRNTVKDLFLSLYTGRPKFVTDISIANSNQKRSYTHIYIYTQNKNQE